MVDSNLVVAAGSIVAVAVVAGSIVAVAVAVAVAIAVVAVVAAVDPIVAVVVAVAAVVAAVGSILAAVADWIESVEVEEWGLLLVPPLVVHYRSKACVPGQPALVMKRLFHQPRRT